MAVAAGRAANAAGTAPPAATSPGAAAAAPQQTTATYGDWVLRCATRENGGASQHVCEVAITMQLRDQQGNPGPTVEVALGRASKTEPMRLTFVFAPDIYIPAPPRLVLSDKPEQAVALSWQRCLPRRCFAEADVPKDDLRRLSERTDPARIAFKDALQRDVSLSISNKGLSEALAALDRQ